MSYDLFLEMIWEGNKPEWARYSMFSHFISPSNSAKFFREADVVKESVGKYDKSKSKRSDRLHRELLVKWAEMGILRKLSFYLFPGEKDWMWVASPYDSDDPIYDTLSPSSAYLGARQAFRFGLVDEICKCLASSARGGLSVENCVAVLKDRLSKLSEDSQEDIWHQPKFYAVAKEYIEEELLNPDEHGGMAICRVWHLENERAGTPMKRQQFELFVKEGDEWKWLPDPKSFWNPTKSETK